MRLALVTCLLLLLGAPSLAELPPPLPHSVFGVVDIADGSLIEAWGEARGYRYAVTLAFWHEGAGGVVYRIDVLGDDPTTAEVEGAILGEIVTFFAKRGSWPYETIGWAAEKIRWFPGSSELLDLHFEGGGIATPTSTETASLRLLVVAPGSGGEGQDRSQAQLTISIGGDRVTLYVSAEDIIPMLRLLLRAFLEGVP